MPILRSGGRFSLEIVEDLPAQVTLRVSGRGAEGVFADEAGGHRWQRVPPNEKRGRVHTSTVTVAVLPEVSGGGFALDMDEVEVTTARGSGPGGQHRNMRDTCVVVRHRPTGVTARVDGRSQADNRLTALAVLEARLRAREAGAAAADRAGARKRQIGSGMRGDKRRTIRTQDGVVTDHISGRRWRLRDYLRGEW